MFRNTPSEKEPKLRRRATITAGSSLFKGLTETDSKIERGNIDFRRLVTKQREELIGVKPKKQQLFSIYHLIMNQKSFAYKSCQAFVYLFSCFECRSKQSVKQKMRSDFYLNKGIKKLEKHLDVSEMIWRSQMSEVVGSILFDEDQQFFINFQKAGVLTSGSNNESADEEMLAKVHEDEFLAKLYRAN